VCLSTWNRSTNFEKKKQSPAALLDCLSFPTPHLPITVVVDIDVVVAIDIVLVAAFDIILVIILDMLWLLSSISPSFLSLGGVVPSVGCLRWGWYGRCWGPFLSLRFQPSIGHMWYWVAILMWFVRLGWGFSHRRSMPAMVPSS
jgi:hypothetical protein